MDGSLPSRFIRRSRPGTRSRNFATGWRHAKTGAATLTAALEHAGTSPFPDGSLACYRVKSRLGRGGEQALGGASSGVNKRPQGVGGRRGDGRGGDQRGEGLR